METMTCFLEFENCIFKKHILIYLKHIILIIFNMLILIPFRESEDTALLLLKEIYDKLGVPFEQPQ